MKKYELTPEHRAQLKPWADLWIARALSTKGMDAAEKQLCADAVKRLYAAAGRAAPQVMFVPSPFVARFAGGMAAAWWDATWDATWAATGAATRAATGAATWAAIRGATMDATRAATEAATWDATRVATWDATEDATWDATEAATGDATWVATWDATEAATRDATRAATEDATRAATEDVTWDATRVATWAATRAAAGDVTEDATGDSPLRSWHCFPSLCHMAALDKALNLNGRGLKAVQDAYDMWQGGNQWPGAPACLSFFRHVAQLPLDYSAWDAWETLAIHSGPRTVHQKFCIISDRPCILKVDAQNRPHCEDGPFCAWRDGSMLFAWHGTRVPGWIIMHPERLTPALIDAEKNAEVRRVMVERYGKARYLQAGGAELVQQDDFGKLWRKAMPGDEPLLMVEVVNATAEPDGSYKDYFLRVHPQLVPLPNPAWPQARREAWMRQQKPQELTARNAVASTFSLRGEGYCPEVES